MNYDVITGGEAVENLEVPPFLNGGGAKPKYFYGVGATDKSYTLSSKTDIASLLTYSVPIISVTGNAPLEIENNYLVAKADGLMLCYGYVYVNSTGARAWCSSYLGVWFPNGATTVYNFGSGRTTGTANTGNVIDGVTVVPVQNGMKFRLCGYGNLGTVSTLKNGCNCRGLFWE